MIFGRRKADLPLGREPIDRAVKRAGSHWNRRTHIIRTPNGAALLDVIKPCKDLALHFQATFATNARH